MERTGGLYAKMEQLALRADASHLTRKASEQGIFAFTATLVVSGCAETEWRGQVNAVEKASMYTGGRKGKAKKASSRSLIRLA